MARILTDNLLTKGSAKGRYFNKRYDSQLISGGSALPVGAFPATPQISYTLAANHFPAESGDPIGSVQYCGFFLSGIENASGSTRSITYKVEKNGNTISNATSTGLTAGMKRTHTYGLMASANPPVVGDRWDISFYSDGSGVKLNQYAMGIIPCRFKPYNSINRVVCDLESLNDSDAVANFTNRGDTTGMFFNRLPIFNTQPAMTNLSNYPIAIEDLTAGVYSHSMMTSPVINANTDITNYIQSIIQYTYYFSWKETDIYTF